ncbi:MAG: RHS repeat protein [Phycisphaerae bacterium]|nr:RHS repeat protein [Phycisphaerae bacterium]
MAPPAHRTRSTPTTAGAFGYDTRDRCNDIDLNGAQLAAYEWLGSAIHSRTTTCDYPGGTKPTIVSAYIRDGLSRVTQVKNELGTPNQNDHYVGPPGAPREYGDLGVFNYTYDDAANPLTETLLYVGNNMPPLRADRAYTYDTLNRLTDADLTDTQDWSNAATATSTFAYDDVGNRLTSTDRDGPSVSYTHDNANRMTAVDASSQTHDAAGNITHTAAVRLP